MDKKLDVSVKKGFFNRTIVLFLTVLMIIPAWAENPQKVYNFSGTVFLDGNVSTFREKDETGLAKITVNIIHDATRQPFSTTTDQNGRYSFAGIPDGKYKLTIDTQQSPMPYLRYFTVLPKPKEFTDCIELEMGINFLLDKDMVRDIGVTQGWMTMPFENKKKSTLSTPCDLDYRLGFYRTFKDNKSWRINGQDDNECGVDWASNEGTPLLAVGPGVVVSVEEGGLRILHSIGSRDFVSLFGHISKSFVMPGQRVVRGQQVAAVGHVKSPSQWNHLHLGFWEVTPGYKFYQVAKILNDIEKRYEYISSVATAVVEKGRSSTLTILDPFRDITNPKSESFWTVDNAPQYLNKITANDSIVEKNKLSFGITSKEAGEIARKYFIPASGWMGEKIFCDKFHISDKDQALVILLYLPGYRSVNGCSENLIGYHYPELVRETEEKGQFIETYRRNNLTVIVIGAKDLTTLNNMIKEIDFDSKLLIDQ